MGMVKSKKIHYTFQNVSTLTFYLRILLLKFIKVLAVFLFLFFLLIYLLIPILFQCFSSYITVAIYNVLLLTKRLLNHA